MSEACQLFLVPSRSSNPPLYPSKGCELGSVPRLLLLPLLLGPTFGSFEELGCVKYNELFIDDKKVYFNGKVKCVNMMHMYINTNQDAIHFTISLPIIDVIIKELFYRDDDQILAGVDEVNDEDEEDHHMNLEWIHKKAEKTIALKCNAMKLFKLNEDNEMYIVDIPNNTRFFLAIDYVGCGMLFRQTAATLRHAKGPP